MDLQIRRNAGDSVRIGRIRFSSEIFVRNSIPGLAPKLNDVETVLSNTEHMIGRYVNIPTKITQEDSRLTY